MALLAAGMAQIDGKRGTRCERVPAFSEPPIKPMKFKEIAPLQKTNGGGVPPRQPSKKHNPQGKPRVKQGKAHHSHRKGGRR